MQNAQKMKEHCKMDQIYALLREYMHCRARAGGTWKTGGSGKLPTHKDNISNYRSSSIEKATDSELFRVSGFSLKTRLHSGTIYVYKRNFS